MVINTSGISSSSHLPALLHQCVLVHLQSGHGPQERESGVCHCPYTQHNHLTLSLQSVTILYTAPPLPFSTSADGQQCSLSRSLPIRFSLPLSVGSSLLILVLALQSTSPPIASGAHSPLFLLFCVESGLRKTAAVDRRDGGLRKMGGSERETQGKAERERKND